MNLLTEPLFRVETSNGLMRMDLPELLEALGQERVTTLPGLQRHQEDAFHIFLCYLAGAVLAREGQDDPRQAAAFWREGIRSLTRADGGEDDSAWKLVVEDPLSPAFMQPPCPTPGDIKAFRPKAATPDELDLLPTAKNHDVKAKRSLSTHRDEWVFALISLQTMSGFFGQGNYGIARMNGGFGSRPVVALDYRRGWGPRWQDHTRRILDSRTGLLNGVWGYRADGLVLTWVPPWDRKTSLRLDELDPFFIEVARPIRLITIEGGIRALGASSRAPRIGAKAANGKLGDPWIPINQKKEAALTVSATGFTPQLLRNLLFEDGFVLTPLQRLIRQQNGHSCYFAVSVLVRGQGTTDGFHQAVLPIPAQAVRTLFQSSPKRNRLAEQSKTALNDSGTMQNRVLKPAILSLLEAGPKQISFDRREATAWWEAAQRDFTDAWSADFFPWLWRTVENPDPDEARLEWLKVLRGKAENILAAAVERYPKREGRRYRARVKAENFFFGSLFKQFPQLKENNHEHASIS